MGLSRNFYFALRMAIAESFWFIDHYDDMNNALTSGWLFCTLGFLLIFTE